MIKTIEYLFEHSYINVASYHRYTYVINRVLYIYIVYECWFLLKFK